MAMAAARDLETRHLLALEAVADTGTFGRAAQRLGYTQSAVSQQIATLERAVGAPLFDRPGGPRPVELTPLGTMLLAHAREILARLGAAVSDIERFQAGSIGRIDVGTFQSVSTALLPAMLARLRTERPDIETRLLESDDHDELVRRVVDGQLDATFLVHDTAEEIERVELFTDPFVVVALPGATGGGAMPIDRLHGSPLIGEHDSVCQRFVEGGLRAAGVTPDYVFRTNDNGAIVAMVRAGMGMAVVPLLAVDPDDPRHVVRPLDPPIPPRRIAIGWRRDRTLSPAAARFVEIARETTADLRDRELARAA